jgi:hypothetical protein
LPLIPSRKVLVQVLSNDQAQHRIAQQFEPFVAGEQFAFGM